MQTYIVRYGDTPPSIAQVTLGDASRWPEIILANPQKPRVISYGHTTFASLTAGEHLYVPAYVGLGRVAVGLGDPTSGLGDAAETALLQSAYSPNGFDPSALQGYANQQVAQYATPYAQLQTETQAVTGISSLLSGHGISATGILSIAATVATCCGQPELGAAIMAVGEIGIAVVSDIRSMFGLDQPAPNRPQNISLYQWVQEDIDGFVDTTKKTPNNYSDPFWAHVVPILNDNPYGCDPGYTGSDGSRNCGFFDPNNPVSTVNPQGITLAFSWDPNVVINSDNQTITMNAPYVAQTNTAATSFAGRMILVPTFPGGGTMSLTAPRFAALWMMSLVLTELQYLLNDSDIDAAKAQNAPAPFYKNLNGPEEQFRHFLYILLLQNWEARMNASASIPERAVLYGALQLWNQSHDGSNGQTYTYQWNPDPEPSVQYLEDMKAGSHCYAFCLNNPWQPAAFGCNSDTDSSYCNACWSLTDTSWTLFSTGGSWSRRHPFVEYLLTAAFDAGTNTTQTPNAIPSITINTGAYSAPPPTIANALAAKALIKLGGLKIGGINASSGGTPGAATPTSTTTKVLVGTAAVAGAGALGTFLYAKSAHMSFSTAAKSLWNKGTGFVKGIGKGGAKSGTKAVRGRGKRRGARENPLMLPENTGGYSGSNYPIVPAKKPRVRYATPKRRVSFRVNLDHGPSYETVVLYKDNLAVLLRYGRPVVSFRPSKYQYTKIRQQHGELLIYTEQVVKIISQ